MGDRGCCCIESMMRHIGQTVTVFTASGGLSGSGFTGVLAGIHDGCVRLITDIGAPPACPVGSSCDGFWGNEGFEGNVCDGFEGRNGFGMRRGWGLRGRCSCSRGCGRCRRGFNWLGSVAVIPCDKIVSFTHNAI